MLQDDWKDLNVLSEHVMSNNKKCWVSLKINESPLFENIVRQNNILKKTDFFNISCLFVESLRLKLN